MDPLLTLLVGLVGGFGLGVLVALWRTRGRDEASRDELARLQGELAANEARAEEREAGMAREKDWLERQTKEMKAHFEALAAKTLEASNKSFLERASERMKPLKEELDKLQEQTRAMEEKRAKAYGSLHKELEGLRDSTKTFQEQSSQLATALRGSSQARGRYGELLLRNVVEMAGMTEHCDFIEQETTESGMRPDVVVKLPPDGLIPIDAKCPMSAFLDAVAADDPKTREALYIKHAKDLRQKVRDLKKADYASQLEGKVDFTVMFLPGDDLLAAAFKYDPDLQEDALNSRVLIATPVTLVALLRTVGVYWKQHDLAQGAEEIQEWAKELHKRVATFVEHLAGIGKHLGQAQDSYNKAIGSYERRVRPAGQKLEQLNAAQGELPEVNEIEEPVRQLTLPQ